MSNLDNNQPVKNDVVILAAKEVLNRLWSNKGDEFSGKIVKSMVTLFTITKNSVEVFSKLENFLLLVKSGASIEEDSIEELINYIKDLNLLAIEFMPFIDAIINIGQHNVSEEQSQVRKGFKQSKKKKQIKTAEQVAREMQLVFDKYVKERDVAEKIYSEKIETLYKERETAYVERINNLEKIYTEHINNLKKIYKEDIENLNNSKEQREKDFSNNVKQLMEVYYEHNKRNDQHNKEYIDGIMRIFKSHDDRLKQKVLNSTNCEGDIKGFCKGLLKEWSSLEIKDQIYPTKVKEPLTFKALSVFLALCFPNRLESADDSKDLFVELNENNITLNDLTNAFVKTKDVLLEYEKELFLHNSGLETKDIIYSGKYDAGKLSQASITSFMLGLVNDDYFNYRKSFIPPKIIREIEYFRKKLQDFYKS